MANSRDPARQAGFTLIELMVVMVIVGILASVGANIYTGHMRQANVSRAIPYLQNIAAKERIFYNRTGMYLVASDEDTIQSRLGVSLVDAVDFCFVTVCTEASGKCGQYSGSPATLGSTPNTGAVATVPVGGSSAFQVVAYLRNADVMNPPGCTATVNKLPPSGWVLSPGNKGGAGRSAVLNYPPANGTVTGTMSGRSLTIDWMDGVTLSDALVD
jgi:prepilin-type N-terminal cleavage/methylation domain-containing protein